MMFIERENTMKKPSATMTRNMLRGLAVIFAANQILHLEENGLAIRPHKQKDDGEPVKIDQDIPFDISNDDLVQTKKNIDELENISMNVLKSVKIGKKDRAFFAEKSEQIVTAFLSSGILDKGISPHLSFVLLLFTYFIDGSMKTSSVVFNPLKDPSIYDGIIEHVEDSKVFDWNVHADVAVLALHKGVGLSMADYDKRYLKPATLDLEKLEENYGTEQ